MSRRNTELLLLIASAFPVILLYAMYVLTAGAAISFETLAVPIGLFAAFAAAHIAVRILAPGADPAILPIVFVLSGIGITFVTRLAPALAISQLIILFVSVALMVGTLALVKNLDVVMRYKYTFGIIGIILLMLTYLYRHHDLGLQAVDSHRGLYHPARRVRQGLYRAVPGRVPGREPRAALHLQPQDPGL